MVRTRIAPSPTGLAHIGTAYAALFNFAFARQKKGKFVLRIEDTDIKRNVAGSEKLIFQNLRWLGLFYDEGPDIGGPHNPYQQSKRLKVYQEYAKQLKKRGYIYEEEEALKLKVPDKDETSWKDLVRGKISWQNKDIKDFVLVKSDGYPTYNFAVVIDDLEMEITHVVRAEEHISNTPRQLLIYQALGVKPPYFAHLPLLRNPDRSKISKRKNPVSLDWYREQGYLPEALINFLSLLGWSHPDEKEIFSLSEFVSHFSFTRIKTSQPVFDLKKLDWLNGEYIRKSQISNLKSLISNFLGRKYSEKLIEKTVPLVKERMKKFSEYLPLCEFFFKKPKKYEKSLHRGWLRKVIAVFAKETKWQAKNLYKRTAKLAEELEASRTKLFMEIRVAVTGKKVGPPLFESLTLLGREEVLQRLKAALKVGKQNPL